MSIIHLHTEWIMLDKQKQNGRRKLAFRQYSGIEIQRTQVNAVAENTKKAMEFRLQVFTG